MRSAKIWIVLGVLVALPILSYALDLHEVLSLENVKAQLSALRASYAADPVRSLSIYAFAYIAITALSLPGAGVLTLAAGAIFGFAYGLFLVTVASCAGAVASFLGARWFFRAPLERALARHIENVNRGMEKEGNYYLVTARLVPIVPFALINLVAGVTNVGLGRFTWTTLVGMLPGSAILVYTGLQITKLRSTEDLFSPGFVASWTALALLPFLSKKGVTILRGKKPEGATAIPQKNAS